MGIIRSAVSMRFHILLFVAALTIAAVQAGPKGGKGKGGKGKGGKGGDMGGEMTTMGGGKGEMGGKGEKGGKGSKDKGMCLTEEEQMMICHHGSELGDKANAAWPVCQDKFASMMEMRALDVDTSL